MMNDDDLKKLLQEAPAPDSERKKEAMNLAMAAFEAQKSAIFQNNSKTAQGSNLLSRLMNKITSDRSNDMTPKNKKLVYSGLFGGLATACVALLIYGGGMTAGSDASRVNGLMPNMEEAYSPSLADKAREIFEPTQPTVAAPKVKALALGSDGASTDMVAQAEAPAAPVASMEMQPARRKMEAPAAAAATNMIVAPVSGAGAVPMPQYDIYAQNVQEQGRDNFKDFEQNSIKQVKAEPVSTFSIDVDTASYAFIRSQLSSGVLPQPDAVRVEEMINYFDYAYPGPASKEEPFKTNVVLKDSPWNKGKKLLTIGIKGYDVQKTEAPDSNLVFLLDTSGSMNEPNKLPLLKQSLSMLLDSLKPTDKVSIVVYAGSAGTILEPTPVSDKGKILQALNNLSAGGSTAGGEGIRLAYQMAQANFNDKAVNRVILATDGDFNVGITNEEELKGFVEREREKGIFLSVLGFGQGNYNDAMMQTLAQNGNGVAAYIDTLNEARKVLVQEASAALFPIAKDVKIQVEFNPANVSEYRLVGYETRSLNTEDFNNDKVDAGDIGAGAEVTAIYEITPTGETPMVDESRYAPKAEEKVEAKSDELAFVKVRYKLPKEQTSKLITTPVTSKTTADDLMLIRETNWAEAVAGFGQLLKGGKFTGTLTYDDVIKQANANKGDDPYGYRSEFINLIYQAKTAASLPSQNNGGYNGETVPMQR